MKNLLSLRLLTITTLFTTVVACGNHDYAKEIVHIAKWGLDAYKNKEVKIWINNVELSEEALKFVLWTNIFDADDINNDQSLKRFSYQDVRDNLIIHNFEAVKENLINKKTKIMFELETLKDLNSEKGVDKPKKFILLKSEKTEITVSVIYLD